MDFRDVSFEVKRGETIGLLGESRAKGTSERNRRIEKADGLKEWN